MIDAIGNACARDCASEETVLVALDGSSLNLTDKRQSKGFGSIGARNQGGTGLKVMTTLAMRMDGTPMGVATQRYWARGERVQELGNGPPGSVVLSRGLERLTWAVAAVQAIRKKR